MTYRPFLNRTSQATAVPGESAANLEFPSGKPATARERLRQGVIWATRSQPSARQVGWIEYLSMMFVLCMYAAAVTPLIRKTGSATYLPGDSDPATAAVQYAVLVLTIGWGLVRRRSLLSMARPMLPYIAILILCFASVSWTTYPYQSLRRCVTLTVCLLYGMYLFDRLGLDGLLKLYTRTAVILAFASIALFVAVPSLGKGGGEGYTNALTGVFAAKNAAGMMMMLAIAGVLNEGQQHDARRRIKAILAYVLLFTTLVLTRSATSTLICLIATFAAAWLWLRDPKWKFAYQAVCVSIVVVGSFTLAFWPEQVFLLLGRDATLTGRVPLWNEAFLLIAKRPWFGYGYSGFWIGGSPDVMYLWKVIGWDAPNAHDGYIDILLQLGIVGLVMYLIMWARIVFHSMVHARYRSFPEASWILLFMLVNVLLNINEGPLPYPDEFTLLIPGALISLYRMQLVRKAVTKDDTPRQRARPSLTAAV